MGLGSLVTLFAEFFAFYLWPSFTLVYPLCASVLAIKSDSESKSRRCLFYWVVFACLKFLEEIHEYPLKRLPFWPYAKGVATFVSVTQCFIRPYLSMIPYVRRPNSLSADSIARDQSVILREPDNSVRASEREPFEGEPHEPARSAASQVSSENTRPVIRKKVQREWCCSLCLIRTSSEKNLIQHFRGKKHADAVKKTKHMKPKSRNQAPTCRWEKPEFGCTKLNTDGSESRRKAIARYGGLLRDHNGDPICAFVSKALIDTNDTFSVEIWAVWRGLVLAYGLGVRVIQVESDSLSVVNTINKLQDHNQKAISSVCLVRIWELQHMFNKCTISHSWREANAAADFLAKMKLPGKDVILWPSEFPEKLCEIIQDDARGRIYCVKPKKKTTRNCK